MKFLNYDEITGGILGFYSKDVHGDNIPEPAIEITDEKWNSLLSNGGKYIIDVDTLEIIEKTIDINELKNEKIKHFNIIASQELAELDWKVLKHKEQLELGIETSLIAADYQELLELKQNIRNKVNTLEQQIKGCLKIEEINLIYW